MEKTNTKRITKAMKFEDIKAMLNGEATVHGVTLDEAIKFIDSEMALLARKNSGDKKPTDKQIANEKYKEQILYFLMQKADTGATCTEIGKGIPDLNGSNNQHIARLVRDLVDVGKATRKEIKGKAVFFPVVE